MNYFIGIDIGTTGAKTILMDENGILISTSTSEYSMFHKYPNWSEQNPEDWWVAVQFSIKNIFEKVSIRQEEIKGIGLTGQMHGLVTIDENGKVLYPCIMWNDQRTASECSEITKRVGSIDLLKITGNPVLPGFTAPKILWLKNNKPEIYARIKKILLPKDYIRYKLTGEYCTDVSDASGTSLLNVEERSWSSTILDKLDIPIDWLPEMNESIQQTGTVTEKAASQTGLKKGTPVFAGAGDQAAGAVGAGAVKEGVVSIVLGTSGVVFTHSDSLRIEPEGKLHAFCHSVPGKWHLMGVTLSAAGSFRWYRDVFGYEEKYTQQSGKSIYDILTYNASRIPAGSEGLLFLPYLSGERTPYPDPDAKGAFIGLNLNHTKAHFTRSVMEGVAFSLRDCYELFSKIGIKAERLVISGGGAKSILWRSMISNIFNSEINTLACTEGAPFGAAILAAVGKGIFSNVTEACDHILKIESTIYPDKIVSDLYNNIYPVYRDLYPKLKGTFHEISKISK